MHNVGGSHRLEAREDLQLLFFGLVRTKKYPTPRCKLTTVMGYFLVKSNVIRQFTVMTLVKVMATTVTAVMAVTTVTTAIFHALPSFEVDVFAVNFGTFDGCHMSQR